MGGCCGEGCSCGCGGGCSGGCGDGGGCGRGGNHTFNLLNQPSVKLSFLKSSQPPHQLSVLKNCVGCDICLRGGQLASNHLHQLSVLKNISSYVEPIGNDCLGPEES